MVHKTRNDDSVLIIGRDSGLLQGVRQVPSPNHDERPPGTPVSLLVIHGISLPPGQFGGPYIDALFTNALDPDEHPFFNEIKMLRVSAHVLIRRDGEIVQYVPFHKRAWHAGQSSFDGCERCNDYSIGIELEGTDDSSYEKAQYQALARLTVALQAFFPAITRKRIAGHSDIAPGRKTDPGPGFSWVRFSALLDGESSAT